MAAAASGERWSLAGATTMHGGPVECRWGWAEMGLRVTVSVCNVAVRADREKLIMHTVKATIDGKLDILVNNAALLILKPPAEYTAVDDSQTATR
ncbi:tropinone reductase homolog At2g29290-like [Miscanthus floridulus]|uniref:tropinone reductase homolog At2g29290-like n=1 Tax=Miscanthus floridulus TaxID=154761 RepID=UPI003459053E